MCMVYFLFVALGFVLTLCAQFFFNTYFFELGKIGSSLLYLVGVLILPKYMFNSWITRPSGKAYRICNALYTEALVFLKSSNYAASLTNVSYTWMALYFHCLYTMNYYSKTLAGHVLICFHKLIGAELASHMNRSQLQSHVNSIYDCMESSVSSNKYTARTTDCSVEAISIHKLIDPDMSIYSFSDRLKRHLNESDQKVTHYCVR